MAGGCPGVQRKIKKSVRLVQEELRRRSRLSWSGRGRRGGQGRPNMTLKPFVGTLAFTLSEM